MRVAILGSGLMGRALAALFSDHGLEVVATTSQRHRPEDIEGAIHALHRTDAPRAVSVTHDTTESVRGADVVIECLPEDLRAKVAELRVAQEANTSALTATNTSSLRVSAIAEQLPDPTRVIGIHFLNPPTLLPVVEVISTPTTSSVARSRAAELVRAARLQPVEVRDTEGFVINRLQFALLREAAALADAGVASPVDIDRIVRDGLARRWAGAGPFETAALGGVQLFDVLAKRLYPHLDNSKDASRSYGDFLGGLDVRATERRRDNVLRALAEL